MKYFHKDRIINKILEILPGFLTWIFLLSPLILGHFYPDIIVFVLTFLTIYWAYKVINGVLAIFNGYRKYKEETAIDWYEKLQKLDYEKLPNREELPESLDKLKHLVLIPIYAESLEILRDSFESIANSSIPKENLLLVYGIEEKHSQRVIGDVNMIKLELDAKREIETMYFVHPQGIPGEVTGVAGPNRDYAARHAVNELYNRGENINNYIFTTFDSDTRIHEHFFARIEFLYLTDLKRKNHFYETAVHVFDNNTWKVPIINRIAADGITIALLASWSALNWPTTTERMDTFSCYSCALTTAIKADFWDPSVGIDDSVFYWRAYKALEGDFEGIPFFLPIHLDAAEGKGYVASHLSLYKQQLRWGWGVITFPMSLLILPKAKKAELFDRLSHMWVKFELFILFRVLAFLLIFGFTLLTLVNKNVGQVNYAYSIPKINSLLLTLTLLGLLPVYFVRNKLKKPMPKDWNILKKIFLTLCEVPLLYVNFLTFGFIPWLEAQTKLMLGKKYKSLYYTPKFR